MVTTLPRMKQTLQKIRESIPYDETTEEFVSGCDELDKELTICYNSLRQIRNRPINEVQHALTNMVEECCCLFWRERIRDGGSYCPDCCKHGSIAGTSQGELRLVVGPKRRK